MKKVMTKNYEIYDKKSTQKKFQAMVTYINYDYKCQKVIKCTVVNYISDTYDINTSFHNSKQLSS